MGSDGSLGAEIRLGNITSVGFGVLSLLSG